MPAEPEGAVAFGIFARAPRPGRAKTRLAPVLGPEGAARLYQAFLADLLERVDDATIYFAAVEDEPWLAERHPTRRRVRQRGEDLGERMRWALSDLLERAPAAAVIGSDLPTLPASRLDAARRALREPHADVVLGPAPDGGYYLIGCRAPAPELSPVRWSTRHALADTLAALAAADRDPTLISPWYDVDTPEDLRLLRAHLRVRPTAAPATARALFDPITPA